MDPLHPIHDQAGTPSRPGSGITRLAASGVPAPAAGQSGPDTKRATSPGTEDAGSELICNDRKHK